MYSEYSMLNFQLKSTVVLLQNGLCQLSWVVLQQTLQAGDKSNGIVAANFSCNCPLQTIHNQREE
ncbi:MAG: hypothetical protein CO127_00685 [Ignavibacteria bacterium CG_4_9_14_3_um_filter_36_18]|nr:MAG: hypothetical protein CO127_00685 [Ignavibacteria bacterium CG_4_9_14_3_um_filter_36_18]